MSGIALRICGAIDDLAPAELDLLLRRETSVDDTVRERTAAIIADVRARGDEALRDLARGLDGVMLTQIEVPATVVCEALGALDPAIRGALERAARNIAAAHRAFAPQCVEVETEPGVLIGHRPDPLARVGVYAPGGRAAYASSVLMGAIPARVAGVREVVLCSPPGPSALPSPVVLAAAAIAGVDRVFAVGGAGAIAAMAFGTTSVPPVDRVVGPGNAYVAEAKTQLASVVGTDAPAGPSELLVVADAAASPDIVAREMIAQAEHDPRACIVGVVVGRPLHVFLRALEDVVATQMRSEIIARALATRGALLEAGSVEQALAFAARYAPEHLSLLVAEPTLLLPMVRNAGTVFLGETSSVAFGDYLTGANHVLPTGGRARTHSGLTTDDFVRWTTYQRVTLDAARALAADTSALALAEGLPAHAMAAGAWRREPRAARSSRRLRFDAIPHYAPDRTPCALDLSDNTNLWGVPPAAAHALGTAEPRALSRYPSVYAEELKRALAEYTGVPPEYIVTGCGSDDVLDSALRALAQPGDCIAFPDPTFAMLPLFAAANGLTPHAVSLGAGAAVDVDALTHSGVAITYLCSPNNPTGATLPREVVESVIARAHGVVIVDEAYIEFGGESAIDLAQAYEHVLVTRTLSKAFGLAGLRVGYAVGSPTLVAAVEKARGPYKVSLPAERAAIAALRHDASWVREHVDAVRVNRVRFAEAASALPGIQALPSAANFVLLRLEPTMGSAAPAALGACELTRRLRARGVAVRPFPALPGVGEAVRVTIGPWEMMDACLAALCAELQCA